MQFLTQIGFRGVIFLMLFTLVSCNRDYVSIPFDSEKEVSEMKFSLEDISPGLPTDWEGYEYVVLEFMITSSQRFHVGADDFVGRVVDAGGRHANDHQRRDQHEGEEHRHHEVPARELLVMFTPALGQQRVGI